MSRIVSFRGQLEMGVQEMIPLSTIKGLIGYKVKKFQIMSASPGTGNIEMIGQIYKTLESSNVNSTPNFSNNRLLGVALYHDGAANDTTHFMATTIFDNEKFNQDIYVNITDATGSTIRGNYYIELEQMPLDLNEATVATLKDIRNTGSQ